MCGILGVYHEKDYSLNLDKFSSLLDDIYYRGPDASGAEEFFMEDGVIKFGHNRLSILDISDAGNQPMSSGNGRYSVIYNGEIYNHVELRKKIEAKQDVHWRSSSDTETLLTLFERLNISNVFKEVEGMFAFALFDKVQKKLIIARDKVGEKPIYISVNRKYLGFSSELRPLRKLPNFNSEIDKISLKYYLQHNYVPHPLSIFSGTFKLPPGSYLEIDLKKFKLQNFQSFEHFTSANGVKFINWWSLKTSKKDFSQIKLSDSEVLAETERLLTKSVKSQLISDVPLGAFLSGGIDSSLIVALMQKISGKAKTFTIGFDFNEFDESRYAEAVANHLGTEHKTLICRKEEVINTIPEINKAFSEPFADSSQIPTMLVSKMAREHVKVVLSGDAGDELFGGYNRYLLANKYWRYIDKIPVKSRKQIASIISFIARNKRLSTSFSSLFNLELSGSSEGRLSKLSSKLSSISDKYSYYKSMTSEWTQEDNLTEYEEGEIDLSFLFHSNSGLTFEEAMMHADFISYLPGDILCKVDRSSMYYSLETRAPFLNRELIEYAYSIPLSFKIREGESKWVLKEILRKYIPNEYIDRPKQGFGIPISHWMRNDLKEWVNDMLSSDMLLKHGFFNSSVVNKVKNEHFDLHHNYEHKLWSLIQFNQWYSDNF